MRQVLIYSLSDILVDEMVDKFVFVAVYVCILRTINKQFNEYNKFHFDLMFFSIKVHMYSLGVIMSNKCGAREHQIKFSTNSKGS